MAERLEKNELLEEFFPDLNRDCFQEAYEERDYFMRFFDLLCLTALVAEEAPEEKTSATTAGEDPVFRRFSHQKTGNLYDLLLPEKKGESSSWNGIRELFSLLLEKSASGLGKGKLLPFGRLFLLNSMTEQECLAVLLGFASFTDRKYERIFAALQPELSSGVIPTKGLCIELGHIFLTEEENDPDRLFDPDSFLNTMLLKDPERNYGPSEMNRSLELTPQTLQWLQGKTGELGELFVCAQYREPLEDSYLCHPQVLEELENVYRYATEDRENCILTLTGGQNTGKRHLLSLLAAKHGQKLLCVNGKALDALPMDRQDAMMKSIRMKAVLEEDLICLYDLPEGREAERTMIRMMSQLQQRIPFLTIGTEKLLSDHVTGALKGSVYRVMMPEIDGNAESELWKEALKRMDAVLSEEISLTEIVSKYTMTPGRIFEAVKNTVKLSEYGREGYVIRKKTLEEQVRRICSVQFGENAVQLKSPFVWEDLIIEPESEELLRRVCDRVCHRAKVNIDFGFQRKMPYGKGLSVLLYGPPGTGKTMAAQVLANELGLDLYRIDISQISSKYIGETEKNLGAVFEAAKNSNAILFFDEADSLFAKRTEVASSNDKHANAETGYLLQKIEEYSGVSILATNNMQNFDHAFKRRMTYLISVGIPNEETREKLWRASFPADAPLSGDVDFELLARTVEISGSNIKSSAVEAAYRAAAGNRRITMTDIADAVGLECFKAGKLGVKNDVLEAMYNGMGVK